MEGAGDRAVVEQKAYNGPQIFNALEHAGSNTRIS